MHSDSREGRAPRLAGETSTAAASSSERPTQSGVVPVRCPHWEVSDSEGHVHIVELTSQDDGQQSFFGRVKGEENTVTTYGYVK